MAETVRAAPEPRTGETKPPVVVKKYANRRLYNTESSSYITLDNLADMIRQGRAFVGDDAKTGEDHHPWRADPDHRGAGKQGPGAAAHRLSAPAHRLLRRPDAEHGAPLSRAGDGSAGGAAGADACGDAEDHGVDRYHVPVRQHGG